MARKLTIFYSKTHKSDPKSRAEQLEDRLMPLQKRELVDSYRISPSPDGVQQQNDPTRGGQARSWTKRFNRYQQWARQTGVGLIPEFKQRELTHTRLEFPPLHLTVRSSTDLKGVFPCVEHDPAEGIIHRYTIDKYLNALEENRDWRTHRSSNPRNLTHTTHDRIQAWLATTPDYLFDEWHHIETEYSLSSTSLSDDDARVDLVFKQADETERYLLIEVKPESDKVDKAFGQLLRYRYAFAEHHTTPDLEPDDVELAIATPEIGEYHERAAANLDITVIQEFGLKES